MGGSSSKADKPAKEKPAKDTRKQSVDLQGRVTPITPRKAAPAAAPSPSRPAAAPAAPPPTVIPPLLDKMPSSARSDNSLQLSSRSQSKDTVDLEFEAIASEFMDNKQANQSRASRKELFAGNTRAPSDPASPPKGTPPTASTTAGRTPPKAAAAV